MKKIRVKDLKDQLGMSGSRPFLYCYVCGQEASAHKGDYFMLSKDAILTCCEEPMVLMEKVTVYRRVFQETEIWKETDV